VVYAKKTNCQFEPKGIQKLVRVAVGGPEDVFGLDSSGKVHQWDAETKTWAKRTNEKLDYIAVGPDGFVCGLIEGRVHWLDRELGWTEFDGDYPKVGSISFSGDGVLWGVTELVEGTGLLRGNRYRRIFKVGSMGTTGPSREIGDFEYLERWGLFDKVVVLRDKGIWTLNNSNLVLYDGLKKTMFSRRVSLGSLKDISIGASGNPWGISLDGVPCMWESQTGARSVLKPWIRLSCAPLNGGKFVSIAVASDDVVWLVREDGTVGTLVGK